MAELRQKAVARPTPTATGRGFLALGGSHRLERFVNEVASAVTQPQTSVSDPRAGAGHLSRAHRGRPARRHRGRRPSDGLRDLIQHLGIASLSSDFAAAKTTAGGVFNFKLRSRITRTRRRSPLSPPTRRSWRRSAAARCCAWPMRRGCPSRRARLATRSTWWTSSQELTPRRSPTATSGFARRLMRSPPNPNENLCRAVRPRR